MIRNPKGLEVWSPSSCNALYIITELEMLPILYFLHCIYNIEYNS
jgi:hypothetical protein